MLSLPLVFNFHLYFYCVTFLVSVIQIFWGRIPDNVERQMIIHTWGFLFWEFLNYKFNFL